MGRQRLLAGVHRWKVVNVVTLDINVTGRAYGFGFWIWLMRMCSASKFVLSSTCVVGTAALTMQLPG